jgi:hypothetical protein
MKKKALFVSGIALLALVALAAQGMPGWGGGAQGNQGAVAETGTPVKIEGKLTLVNGHVAVVTGGKTYYVAIPPFLYGFIDGLKEGAQVKLEGFEHSIPIAPNYSFLRVTKLTVNGKEYDLSAYAMGQGMGPGGMGAGMGPGMGHGRR